MGELLADLMAKGANPTVGTMAHPGQVDVRIAAKAVDEAAARALIAPVEAEICLRLGDTVFGMDAVSLEDTVAARLGARVTHVARDAQGIEVEFMTASGSEETIRASHVLFAVPPRLLEATVTFLPALDAATAERWRATPTWMAPHAKVFALYDKPFWREAGLSGTAQSMAGPLVEIHDATTASGQAALFGFFGLPAEQYAREFPIGRGSLARTLAHILGSEWYYVRRMEGQPVPPYDQWEIREEQAPAFGALEAEWAR